MANKTVTSGSFQTIKHKVTLKTIQQMFSTTPLRPFKKPFVHFLTQKNISLLYQSLLA